MQGWHSQLCIPSRAGFVEIGQPSFVAAGGSRRIRCAEPLDWLQWAAGATELARSCGRGPEEQAYNGSDRATSATAADAADLDPPVDAYEDLHRRGDRPTLDLAR